jgi:hypothetical protein
MSMYQAPTTCALVTPTKPGTAGNWQMQDQGNGFLIAAHDGETRDTCYKKKNAGPPPTPPPAGSYDQIGTVHTNVHYRTIPRSPHTIAIVMLLAPPVHSRAIGCLIQSCCTRRKWLLRLSGQGTRAELAVR